MNHESQLCPKCGAPIPEGSPHGLCPKCLMAAAAATNDTGQATGVRPPPPAREEVAAAFPQLEVLELIGQGGMGAVFKARQPKLDRFVALKILARSRSESAAFAERFTREGRVLARLSHPGIVAVHDFGQEDGFFYLLMEYVDGVNLRQAMRAGRFTPEEALAVAPKICEALQFAHNEGVLHRDIKPENILLDSKGRVKIADFGIAKLVGELGREDAITESGSRLGTPHYMAPEQIERPGEVDHRADIYSLGVVFYEMLTGELPIGRFAPPSEKSAADPRLDEVVFRALEKEPCRRQQSAEEVKTQVETISGQPTASPQAVDQSKVPWRKWALFQTLGLASAALIAGWCWRFKTAEAVDANLFARGFIIMGALFYSYGLPMRLRMRPMNAMFGARFREAFDSERRWYEINAYAGGRIMAWSALMAAIGAVGFFQLPGKTYVSHASWMVLATGLMPWMETKIWLAGTKSAKPSRRRRWILQGIRCVATALVFAIFVRTFVAEPYRVMGDAVAPELPGGSRCIVWKLARPTVGDIVIFERHGDYFGERQVTEQQARVAELDRQIQLVQKTAPEVVTDILPTLSIQAPNVAKTLPLFQETLAMESWMARVGVGDNHPRMKSLHAQEKAYRTILSDGIESIKKAQANQLALAKDKLKALEARLEGLGKFQTGRVVAIEGSKFIIGRNGVPPFPVSLEEIVGRIFLSTRTQATAAAPKPAARALKAFNSADATISKDVSLDADHAWMVDSAQAQVVRLFEVSNPGVDDCVVIYRAKLKTEGLKGRAYLEMLCRFPQFGEAFSRGLDNPVSGSNDWASYQIPFFLKKGEKPDLIKLNLVVEGAGRVWIKDVELSAAPMASPQSFFLK